MPREFLIQRHCTENWPCVLGLKPYIVKGPKFDSWAIPNSLEKYLEYRFRPSIREVLASLGDDPTPEVRRSIAEFLLREGVLVGLWVSDSDADRAAASLTARDKKTFASVSRPTDRWTACVDQTFREIPDSAPVSKWVIEYLSGIPDEAIVNHTLVWDEFTFVRQEVPG